MGERYLILTSCKPHRVIARARARERERERERESQSKTVILNDADIRSVWTSLTAIPSSPEVRPRMSDVSLLSGISGLSFDSTLLSSLLIFCVLPLLFLSCLFFCPLAYCHDSFPPENSSLFLVKRYAFWYGSCLSARR